MPWARRQEDDQRFYRTLLGSAAVCLLLAILLGHAPVTAAQSPLALVSLFSSVALGALLMVAVAWLIEKLVLGKLVNQEGIILFMATIGVSYFDTTLGRPIWWNGTNWVDATGTTV